MQAVLSRIWTRVTVSISHDDNHCSTGIYIYQEDAMESPKIRKSHLLRRRNHYKDTKLEGIDL